MFLWMIKKIVNFPKSQRARVWLKNYPFRKILARNHAEETSEKIVKLLHESLSEERKNISPYDRVKLLDLRLRGKEAALKHFDFVGRPSEFTKGVMYTVVTACLIATMTWLINKINLADISSTVSFDQAPKMNNNQ